MTEILVSLFGALSTIFASYFAYAAHRQGKVSATAIDEINDAVNHRHEKGTPRLYDMVLGNFNRIEKLEKNVEQIRHVVSQHEVEIDIIEDKIKEPSNE